MSKTILITNGTGKQSKAVIDALLNTDTEFTILATTRDTLSLSAKSLAANSPRITLVQGNLNDVPALFASAFRSTGVSKKIWGVFSVQVYTGKGVTNEGEIEQGKAMICQAIKHGVEYFVYASVDRGGDEISWNNSTTVPHFATKIPIETCLKEEAGSMGWCILRPVGFMENWEPGFPAKIFLTALRNKIPADKKLQFVATRDIGIFAAKAFTSPAGFDHRAISLAGDELTVEELDLAFEKATGARLGTTWTPLGNALTRLVPELASMFRWFAVEGFHADVEGCREIHPELMDFVTWLRTESGFVKRD